jgi:formyltetrahydrofolate-dependent phosphoribosylglycinamide formyltransferase
MKRIALFASGTGSNARRIMEAFRGSDSIEVGLVACNNPGAGVIAIAESEGIPVLMLEKARFFQGDGHLEDLRESGIDWIVLAGFLWKVPAVLVEAYRDRIVNIHPALLPKHGGKGMYGRHVHEAVIRAGDGESGITIHLVDERYDHGQTLFQATTPVEPGETPETLAVKIQKLEHSHYPEVIEKLLSGKLPL